MKILGIGNAIVDVICKVEENFIQKNNLNKGTMKLIFDNKEFQTMLSNLKIEKTISGGSVANSIVGLSQLGNEVGFIGKINDDDLGSKYEEGLKHEKVQYFYSKKNEELPTGTCLILVTPDSERTMCTFLGTAGKISENDVNLDAIKRSELILLEGYLWDEGDPKKAFEKAIQNANKVAMSLSDQFCVDRHKPHFLELVKNKLDITFANEQEIISLINAKNFEDVKNFAKELGKIIVVTRGEKGAIAIKGDEIVECGIKSGLNIVDLTGAGDLFASGFLHGHVNNMSLKESLEKWTDVKLRNEKIKLHFIGKLQSNKVKFAVKLFDYIHSLDNEKLAKKISEEQKKINKSLKLFIQINIGSEEQKSGISINEVDNFIKICKELNLNVVGTMCLPPDDGKQREYFSIMEKINNKYFFNELSLGMSNDYLDAVEFRSSFLRVGSKIFGQRS